MQIQAKIEKKILSVGVHEVLQRPQDGAHPQCKTTRRKEIWTPRKGDLFLHGALVWHNALLLPTSYFSSMPYELCMLPQRRIMRGVTDKPPKQIWWVNDFFWFKKLFCAGFSIGDFGAYSWLLFLHSFSHVDFKPCKGNELKWKEMERHERKGIEMTRMWEIKWWKNRKWSSNKQELTPKSWKALFYYPFINLGSCGVPSCIIDLRGTFQLKGHG